MPAAGHPGIQRREGQSELKAASSCSPGTSYQSFLSRTPQSVYIPDMVMGRCNWWSWGRSGGTYSLSLSGLIMFGLSFLQSGISLGCSEICSHVVSLQVAVLVLQLCAVLHCTLITQMGGFRLMSPQSCQKTIFI